MLGERVLSGLDRYSFRWGPDDRHLERNSHTDHCENWLNLDPLLLPSPHLLYLSPLFCITYLSDWCNCQPYCTAVSLQHQLVVIDRLASHLQYKFSLYFGKNLTLTRLHQYWYLPTGCILRSLSRHSSPRRIIKVISNRYAQIHTNPINKNIWNCF